MSDDNNISDKHMETNIIDRLERIIDESKDDRLNNLSSIFGRELENNEGEITEEDRGLLRILKDATSMMLAPSSNNEPFQALMQMADGRRSALPSDFSSDDLDALSAIIDGIRYPPLKARICDLLWLSNKPKKVAHAKIAIDCYISEGVNPKKWLSIGKKEFERAYRLAMQLRDTERLEIIEKHLYDAFTSESDDITYSIADLIWEIGALKDKDLHIASKLESLGLKLELAGDFQNSLRHFQLSSRYYKKGSNEEKSVYVLVQAAGCYAKDAEQHFKSGKGAKLISSSLFESAIHAYRKIPRKYREEYSIDLKISDIRHKLGEAGRNTLDEMGTFRTPLENVDEVIAASRSHVANKYSEYEALVYFSGICGIPNYESLRSSENEKMNKYLFSSLFGSTQYASDGRVVAKTPAVGFSGDQGSVDIALYDKMIRSFGMQVELSVQLSIIPALQQVLRDHTLSKKFIFELCDFSPLVPESNVNLVSNAIWLGFEFEFSTAIHLVAPQVERIVREQLKVYGAHTTHIDKDGIEHENGLSTLLGMEECDKIFGQDKLFELKALFSSSIGPNLRNEVAHGLLTDASADSLAPVYAWWMLLRMVVHSVVMSSQ
mgnify:CR=1 FL=1